MPGSEGERDVEEAERKKKKKRRFANWQECGLGLGSPASPFTHSDAMGGYPLPAAAAAPLLALDSLSIAT